MAYVDKFCDKERWKAISILDAKEMQMHISKLVDSDIGEDKKALAFDIKMFNIELSVLANGDIGGATRAVGLVRKSARILLDYASIDSVMAKADTLKCSRAQIFGTILQSLNLKSVVKKSEIC